MKEGDTGGSYSPYDGEERYVEGFGGETWKEKTIGRPRRKWESVIKICLQEIWLGGVNWVHLTRDIGKNDWLLWI
jgi:hypothetical protein